MMTSTCCLALVGRSHCRNPHGQSLSRKSLLCLLTTHHGSSKKKAFAKSLGKPQWTSPKCPTLADPWFCGFSINHRFPNEKPFKLINAEKILFSRPKQPADLHYRIFSSILGFYPSTLVAHSLPPLWQHKMSPDVAKCLLERKITHDCEPPF